MEKEGKEEGGGEGGGGGVGTSKGTGKSMRKLCRNYPSASLPFSFSPIEGRLHSTPGLRNHKHHAWLGRHVCRTKLPPKNFAIDTKNDLKRIRKRIRKMIRNASEQFLAPLGPLKKKYIYVYIYILYAVELITWPFFGHFRVNNLAMVELITWPSIFEPIKIVFF